MLHAVTMRTIFIKLFRVVCTAAPSVLDQKLVIVTFHPKQQYLSLQFTAVESDRSAASLSDFECFEICLYDYFFVLTE